MVEVRAGVHKRSLGLGHLLTIYGEEAMHENLVRPLETGGMEHPRPEQAVEANDVLADEVIELYIAVRTIARPVVLNVLAVLLAPVLERCDISDGSIHPNVEELIRMSGNLKPKIWSVSGDAPATQRFLEPFEKLVGHIARGVTGNPLLKIFVLRFEFEVEMLGIADDRRRAACCADGMAQFLRAICRAALVAAVAVLSGGAALGALTLHETVRKEHLALFAVELRRRLTRDRTGLLHRGINAS